MNEEVKNIHILGGGPAGMASAYFAKENNIPFGLYESSNQIGGNCKTIDNGDFKYDTGAHRLHDKDEEITKLIRSILNNDLLKVEAPSQIFLKGKLIDFPLNIKSIFKQLNWNDLQKIISENMLNKFCNIKDPKTFLDMANKQYGKTLSNLFLINYTEKLWGEKAGVLSTKVAGDRLKNLNLTSLLKSYFKGNRYNPKHLEGGFYYPKNGFGSIFESIETKLGKENINLNSNVTKIYHDHGLIKGIMINDSKKIKIKDKVLSTLPLNYLLKILNPKPPKEIQKLADGFQFRSLRICILYLNIRNFSKNASIYFPDKLFPFTRIYEPKNRSYKMAPHDKTCIVIEVPCHKNDSVFNDSNKVFFENIKSLLIKNNLVNKQDIINESSIKVPFAYPILKIGIEDEVKKALNYLETFRNLYILGRNAKFEYVHIHNLFRNAKKFINQLNG